MEPSNNQLLHAIDRAMQSLQEARAHIGRLANAEGDVKRAENTLVGVNAQIEAAKRLVPDIAKLEQQIREKRAELAALDAEIAKKNALHGDVDAKMRDLRKQLSGNMQHA
jgi:prefoldin subunit 5